MESYPGSCKYVLETMDERITAYLTTRCKWVNKKRRISKRDLVLAVADNVLRGHWLLARVVDTYPGEDGVVRSAKVKNPTNEYVRPARRLCILEML